MPSWVKPWTAAEDELVRTLSIADAVKATGRTKPAVKSRRRTLKLQTDGAKAGGSARATHREAATDTAVVAFRRLLSRR